MNIYKLNVQSLNGNGFSTKVIEYEPTSELSPQLVKNSLSNGMLNSVRTQQDSVTTKQETVHNSELLQSKKALFSSRIPVKSINSRVTEQSINHRIPGQSINQCQSDSAAFSSGSSFSQCWRSDKLEINEPKAGTQSGSAHSVFPAHTGKQCKNLRMIY